MKKEDYSPPQWPSHRVFDADTRLKSKALVSGSPRDAIMAATKRAEDAIEQLSAQFGNWMQDEAMRLHAARAVLKRDGSDRQRIDALFTCSHDIKGQAATFGYPVAGVVAGLLCDLLTHASDPTRIPLPVIDQHVDAVLAIVRQDVKGAGNAQTKSLIEGLMLLDRKILQQLAPPQPKNSP